MSEFTESFIPFTESPTTDCNHGKLMSRCKVNPANVWTSKKEYAAQWDTGAQKTSITNKVARELNLKIVIYFNVRGVNDLVPKRVPGYVIDLELPGGDIIRKLTVPEGNDNGWDVLIGMDVIQQGDFAVTNFNNSPRFTFRKPCEKTIDFCDADASDS
ncbi:MAG: retroviral-like aspartic protease family protein [Rickettsiales bacterium]|jgi:hypothetical protein|nr:retroviral-like aspartic protease family protein [Rickettsiales bacterium]